MPCGKLSTNFKMERPLRVKIGKTVVTKFDSKPDIVSPLAGKVCFVCCSNSSSYCCPTCFIPYCSATCFALHDSGCTEQFSKERIKSVIDFEQKHTANADLEQESGINERNMAISPALHPPISALPTTLPRASRVKLSSIWWDGIDAVSNSIFISKHSIVLRVIESLVLEQPPIMKSQSYSSLGYQILGVLLGYVITIRSFDGDWFCRANEALAVFSDSTPVFDKSFRPLTVPSCVEAWTHCRLPTATSHSRKHMKTIIKDCASILENPSFVLFALVEAWLLCLCCCKQHADDRPPADLVDQQCIDEIKAFCLFQSTSAPSPDEAGSLSGVGVGVGVGADEGDTVDMIAALGSVRRISSLLASYQDNFSSRLPVRSSHKSGGCGIHDEGVDISRQADLMCRKIYFLLQYCFTESAQSDISQTQIAVNSYILECLDYV